MSILADITEGHIDFEVSSISQTCKTYYKIIGTLQPGVRPLIALHGGPGVNSEYLEILSDVTNNRPGPLIVYDQIGNGLSTHLPEKMGDGEFWTVQLFIDELNNLIRKLGITQYDLVGQSWGGMLGASFAIRHPPGLKHLILFSVPASMDLWVKAQVDLKSKFPQVLQDALDKYEEDAQTTPEYQEAMGYYWSHHLCILSPMPQPIANGFAWIEKDPTVQVSMYGSYQFRVDGSLRDWSVIDQLSNIQVPTLVTNGAADGATDSAVAPFVEKIPNAKWVKFENSSHMAHFEERESFMQTVGNFLYHHSG
ncbi:proline-specific peptidase [Coprinellus micaceus]|uniref:Proline-specific peptidase n=1 Tax=Coprinellus micaceus TaxID=71717 RepID=A0A4Y7TH13_COPMI|nr:proline-specific peptidase [Coprinellus micaceus]